jgi:hypothetical protein
MHCVDPKTLGLATQWSFWAMLEMEALLLDLLQHRAVLPELARDASYAERCSNTKRTSAFAMGGTRQLDGEIRMSTHLRLVRSRTRP